MSLLIMGQWFPVEGRKESHLFVALFVQIEADEVIIVEKKEHNHEVDMLGVLPHAG